MTKSYNYMMTFRNQSPEDLKRHLTDRMTTELPFNFSELYSCLTQKRGQLTTYHRASSLQMHWIDI